MKGKALFRPFWATQVVFEGQKRERKGAFWAIWVEKGRVTMKRIPFGGLKLYKTRPFARASWAFA